MRIRAVTHVTARSQNAKTAVFVGIDIAKEKFDAAFRHTAKRVAAKTMTARQDRQGFRAPLEQLRRLRGSRTDVRFHVGIEHTGPYWRNLADALREAEDLDIRVTLINPIQTSL